MSYNKKVWKSGDRITKEALNNMENGIEAAHQNSGGSGTSYDDTEIKTDINTIKTDLGTDELTTTAKTVKGSINEVNAQYKDIAKKFIELNVKDFGAKGDGTIDDTQAIQDAIDYIVNNYDTGTVYIPNGTYKITSTITFYCDKVNIESCGAIMDCTYVSSGVYSVLIKTHEAHPIDSEPSLYHEMIKKGQIHYCKGIYFKGSLEPYNPTTKVPNGINFEGNTSTGVLASGFNFHNCIITGFNIAIRGFSNSWAQSFINCSICDNTKAIIIPSGGNNYCERFTLINSNLHDNTSAIELGCGQAHIHCLGCSFDYNDSMVKITSGRVYLTNCHLESTKNTDYYFNISGSSSMLMIKSCEWYIGKSSCLGYIDNGIVHIDGGYFHDAGYTHNELFEGTGKLYVNNIFPEGVVNSNIGTTGGSGGSGGITNTEDTISLSNSTLTNGYYINYITGKYAKNNSTNTCAVENYIIVTAGSSYTLSSSYNDPSKTLITNIIYYDSDKTYNYDGDASQETTGTQCIVDQTLPVTFTIPDGISYIRFHIGISSGNLSDLTIDKLSLVKNSN